MENDTSEQTQKNVEDKTSETNETSETSHEVEGTEDSIETLKAQKNHWREQAIDPETGKKYKDLYKTPKEDKTSQNDEKSSKPDDTLLQKAYLRSADIVAEDEVELALETSKKWGVSIDKLVDDEDFQIKLKKLRTTKANETATSNIRGGNTGSDAKSTPEYWIAKGEPATKDQVPNDKIRRQINRAVMNSQKGGGKTFYNE